MKRFYFSIVISFFFYGSIAQSSKQDFDKEPKVQWRFKTNAPIFSSPVISEGVAYFGGLDSTLYAIDVNTGAVKWKNKTNGEIRSDVSVVGDKLYLLGGNGVLSCLNKRTGVSIWRKLFDNTALFLAERRYDFADYYHSSMLIHEGIIYFGTGSNYINAVNSETGEIIWSFKAGDIVHSRPALLGNKIYLGCFDGNVYALNRADGSLAWKFKATGHRYFPKGEMQGFPVASFGQVFIGSRDYNFYSLDANTGQANWSRRFPAGWALSASVKDSVLYVGTSDDRVLLAFDAITGRELWKTDVKFNIFGACEFSPGLIYVPTIWGKLYAIERKTGTIKWAFATDGYKSNHLNYFKPDDSYRDDIGSIIKAAAEMIQAEYNMGGIFSTPAFSNDMMIVTTTEGTVYGLKKQ